jgi:putative chitinase
VNLSLAQICAVMPVLPADRAVLWLPHLNAAMAEFLISTPPRVAAFVAQAAHESGELLRLVENLNYNAAGLRKTWPTRFRDDATAQRYARRPMAIANHVYASRGGNGDEQSGDGWRYRGRGIFQLTFRDNYRAAGEALRVPLEADPDLVAIEPAVACRSAAWFWKSRGLSMLVDAGEGVADPNGPREAMIAITKRINGGLTGLAERLEFWEQAKSALAISA